jgi:hypothetical protein
MFSSERAALAAEYPCVQIRGVHDSVIGQQRVPRTLQSLYISDL